MTVPRHFKFTVRGSFLNSPETWSFGFHMSNDNSTSGNADLSNVHEDQVTAALAALFGAAEMSNKVQVDDWRCYDIGNDGKMRGNGPLLHAFAPNELKGVSSASLYPPQVAVAISTISDNRGPAKRGRFYLPGPTVALANDWRMDIAAATAYAAQATTFLKAVSDSIDLDLAESAYGCNVSPGPPGSSTGTLQGIDHIEVGRALDTIRNRRKSLLEEPHVHGHIDW